VSRDHCSEVHGFSDCAVEVTNLEVQVHHGTLLPYYWRPYGSLVAHRLLENDVGRPPGRRKDGGPGLLVAHGPSGQF
jgi:hypothetical protein